MLRRLTKEELNLGATVSKPNGIKIDAFVIYPGHGLAVVKGIVEKDIGGGIAHFFKLAFPYNKDMEILVPESRIDECGIRPLSENKEINRALEILKEIPRDLNCGILAPTTWKKRQKQYRAMIEGGKLSDVAAIYRDLMHSSGRKELSFGEKDMMQKAEWLISQEIFAAKRFIGEVDDVVSTIRHAVQPAIVAQVES